MAHQPVLVVDDDTVSRHVLGASARERRARYVAVSVRAPRRSRRSESVKPSLRPARPGDAGAGRLPDAPHPAVARRDARSPGRRPDRRSTPRTRSRKAFEAGADDFVRKPFRPSSSSRASAASFGCAASMDALARKEHDAQVVLELTQALASTLDFRDILFTVVQRIAEVAKVDRVQHRPRARPGGRRLRRRRERRRAPPRSADRSRQVPRDPAGAARRRAARHRGRGDAPAARDRARTTGPGKTAFASLAILPILYEGKPMGVLFLRVAPRRSRFGEHELSLCPHHRQRHGHRAAQRAHPPVAARSDAADHRRALRGRAAPELAPALRGLLRQLRRTASSSSTARAGFSSRTRTRARSPATRSKTSAGEGSATSSPPRRPASPTICARASRKGSFPEGRRHQDLDATTSAR